MTIENDRVSLPDPRFKVGMILMLGHDGTVNDPVVFIGPWIVITEPEKDPYTSAYHAEAIYVPKGTIEGVTFQYEHKTRKGFLYGWRWY